MDMGLNGYLDEQLDLMGDGLFDNIEEFFNFSNDVDEVEPSGVDSASLSAKMTDSPPANANANVDVALNGDGRRVSPISDDQMCGELNISDDWITKFLDDDTDLLQDSTFHEADFNTTKPVDVQAIDVKAIDVNNEYIIKDESLFQSLSPVSVLEPGNNDNKDIISSSSSSSSSSFSSSITTNNHEADTFSVVATVGPTAMLVPARARSKRPRRAAIPILPPEVPPAIPTLFHECESFTDESCPVLNLPLKKKTKKVLPAMTATVNQEDASLVRKCLHCGIQKTPQWRAGPMGPKTLCNACGVRYKSGRLFPEYRPAASPTFMPSIHSNSHKKVVEMRNKACQKKAASGMPLPEYPAAKNCDLLEYIRRRD